MFAFCHCGFLRKLLPPNSAAGHGLKKEMPKVAYWWMNIWVDKHPRLTFLFMSLTFHLVTGYDATCEVDFDLAVEEASRICCDLHLK